MTMDGYNYIIQNFTNDSTSHLHVGKVATYIPAPANALQKQLTEAATASTSLPKIKPKAAAHGRVLTSAENLKIIEEREKEKDLKKAHQKQSKKKSSSKETTALITCSAKNKAAIFKGW